MRERARERERLANFDADRDKLTDRQKQKYRQRKRALLKSLSKPMEIKSETCTDKSFSMRSEDAR